MNEINCESLVLTGNGVTPYKTGKLPDGSTQTTLIQYTVTPIS